jgi:hypothetical protein
LDDRTESAAQDGRRDDRARIRPSGRQRGHLSPSRGSLADTCGGPPSYRAGRTKSDTSRLVVPQLMDAFACDRRPIAHQGRSRTAITVGTTSIARQIGPGDGEGSEETVGHDSQPCAEPAPPDGLPTVRGGNASSPRTPQLRALSRHPGPRGLAPAAHTCCQPCERSCAEPTVRAHDTPRPRPGRCR